MPTTRPRYTVTDTGELARMLDLAGQRWPDVKDRRQLLLRLAAMGMDAITPDLDEVEQAARRKRQAAALRRAPSLVDAESLLRDAAWR